MDAAVFCFADDLLITAFSLRTMWQPGGHVEEGETPDEAAKREALEETGYCVELLDNGEKVSERSVDLPFPFNVNLHRIRDGHWHCDFQYLARPGERREDYEYSEERIGWFSEDELEDLEMPENAEIAARKALESTR